MAFKTFTAGVLTSSDVNTFLMKQAVITCTAATRPASPNEGMLIYETDTNVFSSYNGSAWVDVPSLPAATNPQTGSGASAYTFVLADALRLTTASNASAATYTIPPQASVVWLANSVIRIVNYGAGTVTIAGGAGVTVTNAATTLAQFESAALIRTAENAWTLVPFSGAGNANFSNAATGTYTDSGINYKYVTFTGSGTLTVTKSGFADVLVIGGGGGGGADGSAGMGGSAGGYIYVANFYVAAGSITVTVGAGGAAGASSGFPFNYGLRGADSVLSNLYAIGGGAGTASQGPHPFGGSSGSLGGNVAGQGTKGAGAQGGGSSNAIGTGTANSITGTSVTRAAGKNATTGGAGGANTGDGGQGGASPFAGGSGVVIVRVRA
jgi:hypothetical protein